MGGSPMSDYLKMKVRSIGFILFPVIVEYFTSIFEPAREIRT
jgi:hypothetical protein